MLKVVKESVAAFFNRRDIILLIMFLCIFGLLIARCFQLQIVNGEMYLEETTMLIQKTRTIEGTRGNIYDVDGELIAYNILAYSITIEDNGDYDTTAEKNAAINEVIRKVIEIVESNGDAMINSFGIVLDDYNEYTFVSSEGTTSRLRFLADIYGYASTSSLSSEQSSIEAQELIEYLCSSKKFGIDMDALSKEDILTYINVRYAMSLNTYTKYIATVMAEDISDKTRVAIMENLSDLQGVSISEETLRYYNDAYYYSSVIGYTGVISAEEYASFQEEGLTEYTKTDIVGKTGLEQYFDEELQGTKGEIKLYTDNLGTIIDSVIVEEASPGNDVYLTLDTDLMEVTYNLIEETLGGIIYARLQNTLTYDPSTAEDTSDILIPIGDVYNAFFANMILDVGDFEDMDAGQYEMEILSLYETKYSQVTETMIDYLSNENGISMNGLSDIEDDYITYIINSFLKTSMSVIISSQIDSSDEIYKGWVNGSINAYSYLDWLIGTNCIDTSKLEAFTESNSAYSDSYEIHLAIQAYLEENLAYNSGYIKSIYENMIQSGELSGKLICLAAIEQEVFEYSDEDVTGLVSGTISAYEYIKDKIYNIELTAGQLGLEPCSASAVVTDPDSGDVIALISYPGYDINLLANTVDSEYYSKLSQNLSSPFYNHATLEKTAPGSTYKMVVAAAGLTEGVINEWSTIDCTGIFEKVVTSFKCWIYPKDHGELTVIDAISSSCNYFFYEVGYRLGLTERSLIGTDDIYGSTTYSSYSSNLGTTTLAKYAAMFGLNSVSGVEISEASPQISDTSSVPSAIGQGTNNYTTAQLARYVATIANQGTVYDLTLVDKVTDPEGNVLIEYEPVIYNEITEFSSSTWNVITTGMENMVANYETFDYLEDGITVAGKTGTAEQSSVNADHALFIGYAPIDDPEYAIAVRIANGYKSAYTAQIARDILQYALGALDKDEIIDGTINNLVEITSGD